jgi:hypothetical protein
MSLRGRAARGRAARKWRHPKPMEVDAQASVLRVSGFIPDDPRGSAATAARALVRPPTRVVVCGRDGSESGIGAVEAALLARAPNRLIARDPVRAAAIIRPLRNPPRVAEAFAPLVGQTAVKRLSARGDRLGADCARPKLPRSPRTVEIGRNSGLQYHL